MYSTVADMHSFWLALFEGRIVSREWVAEMIRPRSLDTPNAGRGYGLGFWLGATGDAVELEGCDTGVSFRSVHDPSTQLTYTVISNWSDGAWPVLSHLAETLA